MFILPVYCKSRQNILALLLRIALSQFWNRNVLALQILGILIWLCESFWNVIVCVLRIHCSLYWESRIKMQPIQKVAEILDGVKLLSNVLYMYGGCYNKKTLLVEAIVWNHGFFYQFNIKRTNISWSYFWELKYLLNWKSKCTCTMDFWNVFIRQEYLYFHVFCFCSDLIWLLKFVSKYSK